MSLLRRAGFAYVLAVLTLMSAVTLPVAARADEARSTKERINLAYRQAALVQSMSQNACFAMGGLDPDRSADTALEHVDSYQTVLDAFREGHEWMGILPETRPAMLAGIETADAVWQRFFPAVRQIVAGDYHTVAVNQILRDSTLTAVASNALAARFVEDAGTFSQDTSLALGLQLASRQRTMSQAIMMQMCFVYFDIGGDTIRTQLVSTMDEFDANFTILSDGGPDTPPAPNARITRNLRTAKLFWSKMRPVIDELVQTGTVEEAQLRKVLKFNKSVLKQLNQAAEGYLSG